MARLRKDFGVTARLAAYNQRKRRAEVAPWVLEKIAPALDVPAFMIEEYPTADGLEVERRRL
jgi:pyruvate formate-lyase activating enzyme-like uncharacterized protein